MRLIDLNGLSAEPLSHDADITKQVVFRNGTIPHLTQLARARIPPGTQLTPHAHNDMHEVFIVTSGHGKVHCSGHAHDVTTGACIEIAPGEVHAFENDGDADLVVVYFGIAD